MTEQTAIANYLKYSGNKSVDIKVALVDCDGVLYDSMKNHSRMGETHEEEQREMLTR